MLSSKENRMLERIRESENYSRWFFSEIRDPKWFYPLKDLGYMSVDNIVAGEDGYTLYWRTLPYLDKMSASENLDADIYKELIVIIRAIIAKSYSFTINNPYIWHSVLVILNNIPNNIISDQFPIETKDGFKELMVKCVTLDSASNMAIADIAEHILPKLTNKSMITYAETIIEVITDIKEGTSKRALSDRTDAEMQVEPYWLLKAFEESGDEIAKLSEKTIVTVANNLKRTLEYNQSDNSINIKKDDDVYELCVSRVKVDDFRDDNIGYKDGEYVFEIKQYAKNQLKGYDKEEGILGLIGVDPDITLLPPVAFTTATKELFIAKVKGLIPSKLELESTDRYETKLEWLFDRLFDDYSQVWFKSLSGGDRMHAHDANETLTIILRDMLLARAEDDPKSCRTIIDRFLSDEFRFPLFKKYCLYFLNKYWDRGYADIFDAFLAMPHLLREDVFEVELYDILRIHYLKFTTKQNARIMALIEDVPEYYKKREITLINHWKYQKLSPLKDSSYFKDAYNEAKNKAEIKDGKEYEPERYPFRAGIITGKPSLAKEELIKRHGDENLVDELDKFKTENRRAAFNGEPDREGLGDLLKQTVAENPQLFASKINQYKKAPPYFVHRLLWGFTEALKSKKELPWLTIVTFCYDYITENETLLADETETEDAKVKDEYSWSVGDAVDLIEDGANADVLPKECFEKVVQLFNKVSQMVTGKTDPKTERDGINYALNTTFGKIVRSNMVFGLRVARETKSKEPEWGKKNYERYFDRGVEAYIWFGHYFPQLRYLDQAYAEDKLQKLTEKKNTDHEWQAFMEGYLTSANIYDDIYFLPAMRRHYEKALASKEFNKSDDARLVHHITIEYLRGKELLTEKNEDGQQSLFWKLLHEIDAPEKRKRWITVAGYFWSISPRTLRDDIKNKDVEEKPLNSEVVQRILAFWKWTYDKRETAKQLLESDYNHFLGALADLTIYLDKIDEETEKWLFLSAPCCELHHMSSFFIEYLTIFLDDEESVKRMGKIFLKILEGSTPTFRDDDIRRIVEALYKYPEVKADADKICNTYGERGQHFLKELCISKINR